MTVRRIHFLKWVSEVKWLTSRQIAVFALLFMFRSVNADVCDEPPPIRPRLRIVHGTDVILGMAPFMVKLWMDDAGTAMCGGTIVSPTMVVTAAHCFKDNRFVIPKIVNVYGKCQDITVIAGTISGRYLHPSEGGDGINCTQYRTCEFAWVHEQYNTTTDLNDIAVLRVAPPFKVNEYVKPALLPDPALKLEGKQFSVFGFGHTRYCKRRPGFDIDNDCFVFLSKTLKVARLPLYPIQKCMKLYEKKIKQVPRENAFCAGYRKPRQTSNTTADSCQGDSGGPLMDLNEKDNTSTIVGIVSWGINCGIPNQPGIYTDVRKFIDWIEIKEKQWTTEIVTVFSETKSTISFLGMKVNTTNKKGSSINNIGKGAKVKRHFGVKGGLLMIPLLLPDTQENKR